VFFFCFFTGLGKGEDPMEGGRGVLLSQQCGGIYSEKSCIYVRFNHRELNSIVYFLHTLSLSPLLG